MNNVVTYNSENKTTESSCSFSVDDLFNFLKNKGLSISLKTYHLEQLQNDVFTEIQEIGDIELENGSKLKVFTLKTEEKIDENNNKKLQYEKAKEILKNLKIKFGLFVFYNKKDNFSFSFVTHDTTENINYYKGYTYYINKSKHKGILLKTLENAKLNRLEHLTSLFQRQQLIKRFYLDIQNWYIEVFENLKIETEVLTKLLLKTIFVWFLKEATLIPQQLFDVNFLKNVIKNFNTSNNYYDIILKTIFSIVFNKNNQNPVNKKENISKAFYKHKDEILVSEEEFVSLFYCVPSTDVDFEGLFSDNDNLHLPNLIFFKASENARVKQNNKGLIDILDEYYFSMIESSVVNWEVGIDPEILGYVFENILSLQGFDKQNTKRKTTGSYYTPKEIVEFMTNASLLEHLKTKTDIKEDKLKVLLSHSDDNPLLDDQEKQKIVEVLGGIRIIDPAVGSGAFAVGMLSKITHILNKIDSNNKLWYKAQKMKIQREGDVENIKKLLKELDEVFDEQMTYPDYAKKFYIIKNSIYGADIQPMAIQICKLRLFLNLLSELKTNTIKQKHALNLLPNFNENFLATNILLVSENQNQTYPQEKQNIQNLLF